MEENNKYKTSDLYLTAYLKIKNFKYKVEKNNNKYTFIFDENENLINEVDNYLTENGGCYPLLYANAIKNLKNFLYNKK
jgi:hypothetical protein